MSDEEIFQRKLVSDTQIQDYATQLSGMVVEYVYNEIKHLGQEDREIFEGELIEAIPNIVVNTLSKSAKWRTPEGMDFMAQNMDNMARQFAEKILDKPLESSKSH